MTCDFNSAVSRSFAVQCVSFLLQSQGVSRLPQRAVCSPLSLCIFVALHPRAFPPVYYCDTSFRYTCIEVDPLFKAQMKSIEGLDGYRKVPVAVIDGVVVKGAEVCSLCGETLNLFLLQTQIPSSTPCPNPCSCLCCRSALKLQPHFALNDTGRSRGPQRRVKENGALGWTTNLSKF